MIYGQLIFKFVRIIAEAILNGGLGKKFCCLNIFVFNKLKNHFLKHFGLGNDQIRTLIKIFLTIPTS